MALDSESGRASGWPALIFVGTFSVSAESI
jgi:hypothetical protein